MKTYTFIWQCDDVWGEFDLEISEEELEWIREAYRDGFEKLEDSMDLEDLQERALKSLNFCDPNAGQDIRIYFPNEITDEMDEEE